MRAGALTVLILLMTAPLAGCAGSDGDVTVDLTPEEIQELMDTNMDDFLDNMTVSIDQNFYNNTTNVDNHYNNTTVDNSGTSTSSATYNYNGTQPDSEIYVVRLQWDVNDMFPTVTPKRENNFTVDYSYYDYATNDDRTDSFTMACSNYYDAPIPSSSNSTTGTSYWQNNDYFWDWWDAIYNNTIRDLLDEKAYSNEVEDQCREENDNLVFEADFYLGDGQYDYSIAPVFFELDLPEGTAISVIQVSTRHRYTSSSAQDNTFSWSVNSMSRSTCNDVSPIVFYYVEQCGDYFGGWDDIHIDFQLHSSVYTDSIFTFTMYYELVPVANAS